MHQSPCLNKLNWPNSQIPQMMHLFHVLQCTIQNRNVHISVLNGALWDMEQVFCGIMKWSIAHIGFQANQVFWINNILVLKSGVGGAVRFLVVGTIGQGERPPRGQLWMEQCLTSVQILAYLVHNMSRSQSYLGFGHFDWLPSFFDQ